MRAAKQSASHPGSVSSYVIGYILSLEFTIIPFVLVVTQVVTGTGLLATILVFAVLQMLVQMIFFLHLGRGPKPLYNLVFFIFTGVAILIVTGGSMFIINNLHGRMAPTDITKKLAQDEGIASVGGKSTGACQGVFKNHRVTISAGIIDVPVSEARLCDTLTFVNRDSEVRTISFGQYPKRESYSGINELKVTRSRTKSITLNQEGTYMFHDIGDPRISGFFIVKAR